MSTIGKTNEAAQAEQLIVGAKKHFATAASLAFASGTHTPAEIESALQTLIDSRAAVTAAKAVFDAKIVDEATQTAPLRPLVRAFAAFVKVTFANSPDILADFGFKPPKARTQLTVEQKAVATARAKATRAARHTMGTNQKKQVKGTITTIVTPTGSGGSGPVVTGPVAGAPSPGAVGSVTPRAT